VEATSSKGDQRSPNRVRTLCRNQKELKDVKKAAEKTKPEGAQVLRDQLYLVKMDGVPVKVILTPLAQIRDDAVAHIKAENKVKIAKVAWLSSRAWARNMVR
jgi:hypothetical protein